VIGRSYLDMLELYALPQLPPQTILQPKGAPQYFCHYFRNRLDRETARRWIGRGGPIAWPPRSPDLTPLGIFLWSYVKNIVFQRPSAPESPHKGCCGYGNTKHASNNVERGRISSGDLSCHQGSPHRNLLRKLCTIKTLILSLCHGVNHKCV
jgi:hypothetical protein